MKVYILFFLFVCYCFNSFAQIRLMQELENLSVSRKKINTKIEEKQFDYFLLMSERKNFSYKTDYLEKDIIYVNEDKFFSVFLVVSPSIFVNNDTILQSEYKYTLLFDKTDFRCFLIKYYPSNNIRSYCTYKNIGNDSTRISVDFTGKISVIIEMNDKLEPISGLSFVLMADSESTYGDILKKFKYEKCQNNIYVRKATGLKYINIYNATYNDLNDAFLIESEVHYLQPQLVNKKRLFESLEFGW